MRDKFRSVFRWLRRPGVDRSSRPLTQVLAEPYEPVTIDILLEKLEQERKEHLELADRLDRKLLAVITADGVYGAILASIRDTIGIAAVIILTLIVAASLVLAYLAWRPHTYDGVSVAKLVASMNISTDDLHRFLIMAHVRVNDAMGIINGWKAEKLTWAAWLFVVAALPTLLMYALVGSDG